MAAGWQSVKKYVAGRRPLSDERMIGMEEWFWAGPRFSQQNFICRLDFVSLSTSQSSRLRLAMGVVTRETAMTHRDMTIADILKDPLIRQMMRADRMSLSGMRALLQDAARRQKNARQARPPLDVPDGLRDIL